MANFGISMIILNEKVAGIEYNKIISRQRQLRLYNIAVCVSVHGCEICKYSTQELHTYITLSVSQST